MNSTALKSRVKPSRLVRWFEPLAAEVGSVGCLEFTITTPATSRRPKPKIEKEFYRIERLATEIGGEGFKLEKVEVIDGEPRPSEESAYHVLLANGHSQCECKGFLRHNHCKHLESLTAMQKAGRLPATHRSTGQLAANAPEQFADEHTDAECGYQQEAERPAGVNLADIIDEYV